MFSYEELTPPEREVWGAFPEGRRVDLRAGTPEDDDVVGGGQWGPDRTVRAAVIRSLLLGSVDGRRGETPVAHPVGARVSGKLDLVFSEACCVLRLEECWFEQEPQLYGARLQVTGFGGSYLPGLQANSITVAGNLDLMNTRIRGGVSLADSRVDGSLLLQGAHLSRPGDVALDGSRLQVGSGIVGRDGFRADGEIRLREARIGEGLHLKSAWLHHPGGDAMCAESIQITSRVDCSHGFEADGAIILTGATIGGRISFEAATIQHTAGRAVACRQLTAPELNLRNTRTEGAVDLRHARLDVLQSRTLIEPLLHLDGLVYRSLEPPLPVEPRLALIGRDPDGYRPQPYQQLAAVYRSLGHDDDARWVLLAQQRRRHRHLHPVGRAWGLLLDATVGYGYRPWLAALWLLAFTVLGTTVFHAHTPHSAQSGPGPRFSALVYTLDLLIPIGGLGQRTAWYWPDSGVQWLAYVLIAIGWVLTTAVVAGVTRTLSRN